MSQIADGVARYRRSIGVTALSLGAAFMWDVAAKQMGAGLFDLALFVPPSAVLGLGSVWAAHAFRPGRFTWHRGLMGALIGGLAAAPLVAFLVAFSAAWDRPSFQFVFNLGAWLALVAGLAVGATTEVLRWIRRWRSARSVTHRRLQGC